MQVRLHGYLKHEQHAEDFVAHALLGGRETLGENVSQPEEPLAEVVVGACEVEDREGDDVDGGGRDGG